MTATLAEYVGPHELEEPTDNESMTQTSAVVFQSMVIDMEVDEFIQPKKPLKRTRGEAKTTTWVSEAMYEALSMVDVTPHQEAMPTDVPVTSFSMDMRIPSSNTFHGRTSIRRLRIRAKHMSWHPNNLTMREIVFELQKLEDEYDPFLVQEPLVAADSQPQENIAPIMEEARAVDLWKWVCADPTKANVTLSKVFLRDPTALRTVAHLHAWHRLMVATKLPQVSSFQSGFEEVFGVPPTAAFLATAFGQHANIRATGPSTLDVTMLDIELALAVFELLLATQTAPYFHNEAWPVCMTQQPVLWLPVHKTRPTLASYTLWGLLHPPVGHSLVTAMRTGRSSELLDVLALLQAREYR
ncbi:hypothetical protein H310_15249 [Aphanomyces invadans]|uniref:Uncharacterized protein n=1 Tax=Aphanomyces invadans TaxID=157072 RepID=A0A024T9D4_9STRA|nr:hypothetical protein H310_15249 [Aphanomyces invadans]ETV89912.1 hypothetical protein H310_15249 [Aphanomyces invadans]|eukprot:XP_008881458.1 hypothetical protein H310_15249 [Aphanomyces invadans]